MQVDSNADSDTNLTPVDSDASDSDLAFKSPVESGFFPFLTATATGCLIWKYKKNWTETEKNRKKPVATGRNWFELDFSLN
jgi:hypothetical protein